MNNLEVPDYGLEIVGHTVVGGDSRCVFKIADKFYVNKGTYLEPNIVELSWSMTDLDKQKQKAAEEYSDHPAIIGYGSSHVDDFLAGADWAIEKMKSEMKFSCTCPECSDNENTLEALRKDG